MKNYLFFALVLITVSCKKVHLENFDDKEIIAKEIFRVKDYSHLNQLAVELFNDSSTPAQTGLNEPFSTAVNEAIDYIWANPQISDADFIETYGNLFDFEDRGDGDFTAKPKIQFSFFQNYCNADGLIVIQDTLYHISNQYFQKISFEEGLPYQLQMDRVLNAEKEPIRKNTILNELSEREERRISCRIEYASNGWRYEMVGEVNCISSGFYNEIKTENQHRRRRFWVWWPHRTPQIAFNGSVSYRAFQYPGGPLGDKTKSVNDVAFNETEVHQVLDFYAGAPLLFVYYRVIPITQVIHSCNGVDRQNRNCNTDLLE